MISSMEVSREVIASYTFKRSPSMSGGLLGKKLGRLREQRLQIFQNIVDAHHELCALLNQTIRTVRGRPVDRAGNSVKIASLVCRL